MDNPPLREAYNANLPKITQYWTELGQNQALFEKYKALHDSSEFSALSPARKKIVENALRDFRLGGAELPADKKQRYAAIQEELAALSAQVLRERARRDQCLFDLSSTRSRLRAFRTTSCRPRARPRRRTARTAGSSRCTCPPTCR